MKKKVKNRKRRANKKKSEKRSKKNWTKNQITFFIAVIILIILAGAILIPEYIRDSYKEDFDGLEGELESSKPSPFYDWKSSIDHCAYYKTSDDFRRRKLTTLCTRDSAVNEYGERCCKINSIWKCYSVLDPTNCGACPGEDGRNCYTESEPCQRTCRFYFSGTNAVCTYELHPDPGKDYDGCCLELANDGPIPGYIEWPYVKSTHKCCGNYELGEIYVDNNEDTDQTCCLDQIVHSDSFWCCPGSGDYTDEYKLCSKLWLKCDLKDNGEPDCKFKWRY